MADYNLSSLKFQVDEENNIQYCSEKTGYFYDEDRKDLNNYNLLSDLDSFVGRDTYPTKKADIIEECQITKEFLYRMHTFS